MKFKIAILLLSLLLIPLFSFSQLTGGGGGGNNSSQPVKKAPKGKSRWWSVINVGIANPTGAFKENNLSKPFEEAVGATPGPYLQFDNVLYVTNLDDPFKVGITFAPGFSYNGINWEKWTYDGKGYDDGGGFFTAHFLIGTIGSYELSPGLNVDAFFKLGLNAGITKGHASWSWEDSNGYTGDSANFDGENNLPVGLATNFGVNFRFHILFITAGFNLGKLKYDYSGGNWGNISGTQTIYELPINTFRFGVGLKMGRG